MRLHAKSIASAGVGVIAFATPFLGLPRWVVFLLLAFGAFLVIAGALMFMRERALNAAQEQEGAAGYDVDVSSPSPPRVASSSRLVIATTADAARAKVEKWIRRGEELSASFVDLPANMAYKGKSAEWMAAQMTLAEQAASHERNSITNWHQRVIRELQGVGGGALGLYSANESVSHAMFGAIPANRQFLQERLAELREIVARIDGPFRERTIEAARRIRTELIDAQRKATAYIDALAKMPTTGTIHYEKGFRFKTEAWDEHAAALAAVPETYAVVEAAYQQLGRANDVIGWRATSATGLYGINREEDDLPGVVRAASAAIEAFDQLFRDR